MTVRKLTDILVKQEDLVRYRIVFVDDKTPPALLIEQKLYLSLKDGWPKAMGSRPVRVTRLDLETFDVVFHVSGTDRIMEELNSWGLKKCFRVMPDTLEEPPGGHRIHVSLEAQDPIMKQFRYEHLPERLQPISKAFADLAKLVLEECAATSEERHVALRKLLEGKDAAVRAALEKIRA